VVDPTASTTATVLITTNIIRTRSVNTGSVVIHYKVAAFPDRWFPSAEVFDDETAAKAAM
jgi:hypothetical protein